MALTKLTKNGYQIPIKDLSDTDLKKIQRDLTVVPLINEEFGKEPEAFEIYRQDKTHIYLPRFYGIEHFGNPKSSELYEGDKIDIKFTEKLRPYQIPIIDKICNHFINSGGGGVLTLPCGKGKTIIGINLISRVQKKTIVVVHKEFLMRQWRKRLGEFTNAKVGIIQGKKIDVEGKDVVIAMVQSLSMKDYDPKIFKSFGFALIDECHHNSAPTFSRALHKIMTPHMLGISATPDRPDGLSKVLHWHLGPMIHREEMEPNDYVKTQIYKFKSQNPTFKQYWRYNHAPDMVKTLTKLTEMKERNDFIVDRINEIRHLPERRKILVISERINHLKYLEKMVSKSIKEDKRRKNILLRMKFELELSLGISKKKNLSKDFKQGEEDARDKKLHAEMLIKDQLLYKIVMKKLEELELINADAHTTGFYIGKMKQYELAETEKNDIIFGSYGMAEEGLDIVDLNAIFLTTPRSRRKVVQSVGRILRLQEYVIQPLVVDIIDQLPRSIKQGEGRESFYQVSKYILEYFSVCDQLIEKIDPSLIPKAFLKTVSAYANDYGFTDD